MGKYKRSLVGDIKKELEREQTERITGEETVRAGDGLLSDISRGSVLMKITNLPRAKIRKNPKNRYSIEGIASLAESIKQYGLIQPLHIMPEQDGTYMLLGGERRLTAIDELIADPDVPEWNEETLIPCVVKGIEDVKLNLSAENKERYAILTTNRESREYTDGDRYMEIEEWKKIIEELREKGIEYISRFDDKGKEEKVAIKGEKTRNILSKTTGVSVGQLHKYETVSKKAGEELQGALMGGKISVNVAAKAANELDEKGQKEIAAKAERGETVTPSDITNRQTEKEKRPLTGRQFREDIKTITSILKEQEIFLDEMEFKKYRALIKKIETLLRDHDVTP